MKCTLGLLIFLLTLLGTIRAATAATRPFFLKNGDRVCFYGDSITEQRFYTTDVELYVRTRFPGLHVEFINSGVGGDSVNGGWAGSINLRLKRDVFAFKPNVVTIMLAMNDAGGAPFNLKRYDTFRRGYKHIIKSIRAHLPGARIVLIGTSPFDDVTQTRASPFYNGVLVRYNQFVQRLAAKNHLPYVDFNTPMVKILTAAKNIDPVLARQLIPKCVHPDANAQLVMAEALLKAWNAPATVTDVDINAGATPILLHSTNTTVSALTNAKGIMSWSEMDQTLPMPVMDLHENWPQFPTVLASMIPPVDSWPPILWEPRAPKWNYTNPSTALVLKLSDFYRTLARETLKVKGLAAPQYTLNIDGRRVGLFSRQQLGAGINLERYDTPMMAQGYRLLHLTWKEAQTRFYIWRYMELPLDQLQNASVTRWLGGPFVQLPMGKSKRLAETAQTLIGTLYKNLFKKVAARDQTVAAPASNHFELIPAFKSTK